MVSLNVINRDLFARLNITQGEEENVAVNGFHECVWGARVVDVVCTVAARASV